LGAQMSDQITTKTDLILAMDREWEVLQRLIAGAGEPELTHKTDAAGWSSKDHLAHLAAWGNSVLLMVRDGTPRWDGLGIDRAIFSTENYDEENKVIRKQTSDWSLAQVTAHLENVYLEFRRMVDEMSDADLLRPLSDYAEGGEGETLMRRILGTFPWHFEEHREYIERILTS